MVRLCSSIRESKGASERREEDWGLEGVEEDWVVVEGWGLAEGWVEEEEVGVEGALLAAVLDVGRDCWFGRGVG